MKIAICTEGAQGILLLQKLFSLKILPKDFIIITDDSDKNKPFLEFLNYYKKDYLIVKRNMEYLKEILLREKIELLLSVNYRFIFSKKIVELDNIIKINLHPGLLPEYKGCMSTPWSIINNEEYTGFTYHIIREKIDEGEIIYQKRIKIEKDDTAHSLYYKVYLEAIENIDKIFEKNLRTYKLDIEGNYYQNKLPFNGEINTSWEDSKIERFIRAMVFPPFKGAILELNGKKYEILDYMEYKKIMKGRN